MEAAIRALEPLISRGAIPEEFFGLVVRSIRETLGCRYAGIGTLTADGKVRMDVALDNGRECTGNEHYELTGTPCAALYGDDTERFVHFEGGLKLVFPSDRRLADKDIRVYVGEAVRNANGETVGHVFAMHDRPIQAKRGFLTIFRLIALLLRAKYCHWEAEQMLQESDARYHAIVEDQTEMISRHLPDGARTFVNSAYCRFHGKPAEELLGRSVYESMAREDVERLEALYATLTPESPTGTFEVSAVDASGNEVRQLWTKRAIFDGEGYVREYQAVGHDITELMRSRDQLVQALNVAQEANRAKSNFLAAVSHELRTPLNAILGFAALIEGRAQGAADVEKDAEYAGDIRRSGLHLLELIENLLDLPVLESDTQSINRVPVQVESVLGDAVDILKQEMVEKDISLKVVAQEDMSALFADRVALRQIFINILSNAIKFSPAGSRVEVNLRETQGHHVIVIRDEGPGISPGLLPRVTEAFVKANQNSYVSPGGMGLGLAVVDSLVRRHDGTLEIESELGCGTAVIVDLPSAVIG